MKSRLIFFLSVFLFFLSADLSAQDIGYGFKAGLNFSKFISSAQTDADGNSLESFDFNTGFHVGGTFDLRFSEHFGMRTELVFTQKGTEYIYDGPSYFTMTKAAGGSIFTSGSRKMTKNITHSYLEVPILVYAKPIKKIEFSGGLSFGVLLSSTAGGELKYEGTSDISGQPIDPIRIELDHNYKKDDENTIGNDNFTDILVDNSIVKIPEITGAYYEYPEKDKNYYKTLDIGLTGGVIYYLNSGLYLGGRVNYSLSDISQDTYDVLLTTLDDDKKLIPAARKDLNLSIQVSLGFSF